MALETLACVDMIVVFQDLLMFQLPSVNILRYRDK